MSRKLDFVQLIPDYARIRHQIVIHPDGHIGTNWR